MKNSLEVSTKGRIGALLTVIGSAVLLGCLAAAFMVFYYGPSGTYLMKNVLLSPKVTEPWNGNPFYLEQISYSHWDSAAKQWRDQDVSLKQYEAFYELVNEDKSLSTSLPEVSEAFYRTHPSTLTLFIRSEKDSNSRSKPFQSVQFADRKDYFRVELHVDTPDEEMKWAYFFHPGIENQVKELFYRQ